MSNLSVVSLCLGGLLVLPVEGVQVYRAELTSEAVVPGSGSADPFGVSTASGWAEFIYDPATGEASYEIMLDGLHFSDLPTPNFSSDLDLVRGVHLHIGEFGTNGPHALNIFGLPGEDDADLFIDPGFELITGAWDDSDENFGTDGVRGAADSAGLSTELASLQAEELYLQIHTFGFIDGELRGQLVLVPEPGAALLCSLGLFALARRRRA